MNQLIESDASVELIWRAYELRPEPVPMIDPNSDYLRRVWTDSVAPLAQRLGVTMRFPPVKPRTRLAHEAAHWARAQGGFDDYHKEIFRAFFERGEDIGDAEVLIALAQNLEIPGAHGRTGGFRKPAMPGKHRGKTLFEQHAQRFAQAEEEVGGGRGRKKATRVRAEHRVPRPVRARHLCVLRCGERPGADRIEAKAGRQHHPLL